MQSKPPIFPFLLSLFVVIGVAIVTTFTSYLIYPFVILLLVVILPEALPTQGTILYIQWLIQSSQECYEKGTTGGLVV